MVSVWQTECDSQRKGTTYLYLQIKFASRKYFQLCHELITKASLQKLNLGADPNFFISTVARAFLCLQESLRPETKPAKERSTRDSGASFLVPDPLQTNPWLTLLYLLTSRILFHLITSPLNHTSRAQE